MVICYYVCKFNKIIEYCKAGRTVWTSISRHKNLKRKWFKSETNDDEKK